MVDVNLEEMLFSLVWHLDRRNLSLECDNVKMGLVYRQSVS